MHEHVIGYLKLSFAFLNKFFVALWLEVRRGAAVLRNEKNSEGGRLVDGGVR